MRRPTAGFTMVEVLVAVLLLAVGLVGALAMQAHAMRTRQESALQSEALQAAATLADRIRANAGQSSAYIGFEFDAAASAAPSSTQDACSDAPCDTAALAQRELAEFRQHLQAALPLGRAAVCRDAGAAPGGPAQWVCDHNPEAPVIIKIGWRSRQPGGAAQASGPQVTLPVEPAPGGAP